MGISIGIDLGTTNTVVAVLDGGRPRVLKDDRGYAVLPSCVAWNEDGTFVVGHAARSRILIEPDRTVWSVKRLIGRRFDSEEVQESIQHLPYRIEEAPDGGVYIALGDRLLTPVEVSAIILQVAREIAENSLGEEVEEAVITVPAYFNHAQRSATLEAARVAGLPCERLLNEPTSAALAYGHQKDIEKTLLIFDLGGGTFDVSVLHLSGGVYEILATSGDSHLGGDDFDFRLADYLADRFRARTGIDIRDDAVARQRLRDAAERAKCELSFSDRTTVYVPQLAQGQTFESVVSRQTLESLVAELVDRTVDIARRTVTDAGLRLGEIDDVILVGGQTRMPRVREVLANLFHKEPHRGVHPEEVVAIGAAVHANSLANPEREAALLIDVTPFDLGIDAAGGYFTPVIERNSKIPAARTRTFTTVVDNQEKVRVTVRQGSSTRSAENEFLGEFVLTGIKPAPRMEPKLDVSFRIDASGMLHVSATDRATGERQQITVRNYAEAARNPHMPDPSELPEPLEHEEAPRVEDELPMPLEGEGLLGRMARLFPWRVAGRPETDRAAPAPPPDAPVASGSTSGPDAPGSPVAHPAPVEAGPAPGTPPPGIRLPEPPPGAAPPEPDTELPEEAAEAVLVEEPEPTARPASYALAGEGAALSVGEDDLVPFADVEDADDEPTAEEVVEELPEEAVLLEPGEPPEEAVLLEPEELPEEAVLLEPEELPEEAVLLEEPAPSAGERPAAGASTPGPVGQAGGSEHAVGGSHEADVPLPPLVDEASSAPPDPGQAPPAAPGEAAPAPPRDRRAPSASRGGRKPARLRLTYERREDLVRETRENLAKGRVFIPTPKPLSEGRACLFELVAPGLEQPLHLSGEVVWSSRRRQEADRVGMEIAFRPSSDEFEALESVVGPTGRRREQQVR